MSLEEAYEEIKAHMVGTEVLHGVAFRIAKIEKDKLGIKEWSEL